MLGRGIKRFGIDAGSGDHPMNAADRFMRPDLAKRFEKKAGMSRDEFLPRCGCAREPSGRLAGNNLFPFHDHAFQEGLVRAENVGGDIEMALGRRGVVGAFPWRREGLEACPRRILFITDAGDGEIEAPGPDGRLVAGAGR